MPLKIIRENQTQLVGRGPVLLAVLPMTRQAQTLYAGKIAEEVALLSKVHAIISGDTKGNLTENDLPPIKSEFEADLQNFVEENHVEYVLQIAGMNDPGVEIRTIYSGPQTEEIVRMMKDRFGQRFRVKLSSANERAPGGNVGNVPTISIALGPEERGFQKNVAIAIISNVVDLIRGKLGKSERDEGISDGLH